MIYLDNAATSWPKPARVVKAMEDCLLNYCANPGRSGHKMAGLSEKTVYQTRCLIADFFGVESPQKVIFTPNATQGLNVVIKGILNPNSHAIVSSMEHNSVMRPLAASGAMFDMVMADECGYVEPSCFEKLIKPNTSLIVCTLSSNVCGSIQPIESIAGIARRYGIPFLLDGSQGAGCIDIDMQKMGIDYLVAPGHKGLLGPTGTGVLCINSDGLLHTILEGGTGSDSKLMVQPEYLPDRYESGTVNVVGIAGLAEGIKYITSRGIEAVYEREQSLCRLLLENLSVIKGVSLKGVDIKRPRCPVVSFVFSNSDSLLNAFQLAAKYDIALRAGYHCAYNAHVSIGTKDTGTIRASLGAFNTKEDIEKLSIAVKEIALQIT